MNGLVIGALVALSMAQQTDTTFALGNIDEIYVETMGGSITVDTWERSEVRVRAEHSTRTYVRVRRSDRGRLVVEAEARRGPSNIVDFHLTVPRAVDLVLDANYADITVNGARGRVKAETVQGDIQIRGGRGEIVVSNTVGDILIEDSDGRVEIESSAANVRVRNTAGEIFAETAGGTMILENITASSVDVGSTGGRVYFDGSIAEGGSYFFGSHGGSITLVIPDGTSAALSLATMHGTVTSNLDGQARSYKGGERHRIEVGGGGSALIEAETYGGRISVVRRGSEGSEPPTPRRRNSHGDANAFAFGWAFTPHVEVPHVQVDVPWVHVEVPHVQVDVNPSVQVQVDPHVQVEVNPNVQVEVEVDVDPRVVVDVRREVDVRRVRREPATIRR